jgi:putative transposase
MKNLTDYPFSSFHQYIEKVGRENLRRQFSNNNQYQSLILTEDKF